MSFYMTHFKFVGRISSQGKNLIIWIPKEFHNDVKKLKGKQIKIIIDDDFWINCRRQVEN